MARSNYIAITLFTVFLLLVFYQVHNSGSGLDSPARMWTSNMAADAKTGVTHTVLFQFKEDVSDADVQAVSFGVSRGV